MTSQSATRVDQYRKLGFLVVENLVSKDQVEHLRQRTEDISAGRIPEFPVANIELEPGADRADVGTVRKLNRCAESDPFFLAHTQNERILDIVESLLGPDIKLFGSQCFMKPPGGVEKPYHQDSAYFTIEPTNLVTCWTALDDVVLDNGPMWVIPGSHRQGIVDHSQEWMIREKRDMQVPDELFDRSRATAITMPAGSCSFHHSLLLHSSTPNHTDRPRRGLAVHYMSAQSHWTHGENPQPTFRLLRGREYPSCV